MATLTIRRLPEETYERLRERARSNNRSLEAEVREILAAAESAEASRRLSDTMVDDLIARHRARVARYGYLPDSTPLIRAMRDEE